MRSTAAYPGSSDGSRSRSALIATLAMGVASTLAGCADEPLLPLFSEGPEEEMCSDGVDNDLDARIDCEDEGCAEALVCRAFTPGNRDVGSPTDVGDADDSDSSGTGDPDATDDASPPTDVRPADATQDPVSPSDATREDTGDPPDAGPDAPPPDTDPPLRTFDRSLAVDVCERWRFDRRDLREGVWSGDASSCDPGDIDRVGRENTLTQVNLVRWLAWLNDDIDDDEARNGRAQACALITDAAGVLDHHPSPDSRCYTPEGAAEAGRSSLSPTPSVEAVDLYMADPGNATTLGHRRWILADSLGPIGMGSTNRASCLSVIGGSGTGRSEWTAWPAPGPFPLQAMNVSWSSVDANGWSLQSDSMNLASAEVTIHQDGVPVPVTVNQLAPHYGSTYAISIVPVGWRSRAGSTYSVQVEGISVPIAYEVEMLACD